MDELASLSASTAALGWSGVTLPSVTLFGCRFQPVVAIDGGVHADRAALDVGPQLDDDVLAIWEWPESPELGAPITLCGALFEIGGSWRRQLLQARRWSAFSPTALIDRSGLAAADEWCCWECGLAGVGLVDVAGAVPDVRVAAEDRSGPGGRVTADRWVEEFLYSTAVRAGVLTADLGALTEGPRPGPGRRASSGAPSARSTR